MTEVRKNRVYCISIDTAYILIIIQLLYKSERVNVMEKKTKQSIRSSPCSTNFALSKRTSLDYCYRVHDLVFRQIV